MKNDIMHARNRSTNPSSFICHWSLVICHWSRQSERPPRLAVRNVEENPCYSANEIDRFAVQPLGCPQSLPSDEAKAELRTCPCAWVFIGGFIFFHRGLRGLLRGKHTR